MVFSFLGCSRQKKSGRNDVSGRSQCLAALILPREGMHRNMSRFKSVVLAFRPKTLTAALVPCVAATALAHGYGSAHLDIFIYALLAAFFIQIGTNLVNDAVDFKKGADTETRIGPQRITQAGILTHKQVMMLGTAFFGLAILCGIPLVLQGGWIIVVVGLVSVLTGYAYTAGPFPLAYLGLGDLFVVIFFGLVAVIGMFYLQTEMWSPDAIILGLQIGLHATVLIAINNLRDVEGDRLVHKKTLPVRFGVKFARFEIAFLALAPFLLCFYWLWTFPMAAYLPAVTLPLAFKIIKNVFKTKPSAVYNKFLGQSAGLHLLFGLLTAVGLALS
jgi:1,4-dihydroxy-2-naphthoate octaprenyltransferase